MTSRSIRRAQERRAKKLARRAEKLPNNAAVAACPTPSELPQVPEFSAPASAEPAIANPASAARLLANRANAQRSTGPTTSQGKAISSLNAVKTALTGRIVLLPTDDVERYQDYIRTFTNYLKPVGPREADLVQSIADTSWRLARIPSLEMAIFAKGRIEFAEMFPDDGDLARTALRIDLETFLAYQKEIRNLQLQESRLQRRKEKDLAELRQLQQERKAAEEQEAEQAVKISTRAHGAGPRHNPACNPDPLATNVGFEFSTAEIDDDLATDLNETYAAMHAEAA